MSLNMILVKNKEIIKWWSDQKINFHFKSSQIFKIVFNEVFE
jgi:hypothetical protein